MAELKIGDRIKDNDWRMGKRELVIIELNDKYAICNSQIRLMRERIFTDTKVRKTGFSRIGRANV